MKKLVFCVFLTLLSALSSYSQDMTLYVRKMAPRIFTAAYAFRITGNKAYYDQAIKNVELFIDVFRE